MRSKGSSAMVPPAHLNRLVTGPGGSYINGAVKVYLRSGVSRISVVVKQVCSRARMVHSRGHSVGGFNPVFHGVDIHGLFLSGMSIREVTGVTFVSTE